MRVISGKYASRKLITPRNSKITRPTQDRVKESLFMKLENRYNFDGAICLDLFAGSGALGIESISRGAMRCYLIDNNDEVSNVLKANTRSLNLESCAIIRKLDYMRFLKTTAEKFDFIFIDPPYLMEDMKVFGILSIIEERSLLNEGGVIIVERSKDSQIDIMANNLREYATFQKQRYGDTVLVFIEERAN